MQPIAPKDRPKLVAVAIAIVVALAFVVRNLIGIQANAQSMRTEQVAATPALSDDVAESGSRAPAEADAATTDSESESEETIDAVGAVPLPVLDPFRPLERVEIALTPAVAPGRTASAPAPVQAITAINPTASASAESCQSLQPAASAASRSLSPTAPGRVGTPSRPTPAQPDVRLVGTVRQAPTALAVFRGGEKARYIRPQEVIARWRVVRIDDGQVSLRRRDARQIVRVGERLPTAP